MYKYKVRQRRIIPLNIFMQTDLLKKLRNLYTDKGDGQGSKYSFN